ncbi:MULTISPECIES: iron transporter [unclassified Gilliamella]|uniref:iron transporter n=1 Tax=unclassified Gilliamella TaxID=2685620 RepID=UPI001C69BFD7|nr:MULTISPECIES: iron transporter [unclassified Gilliamella]MCX8601144.1 iron transporter [Gilliamella sp. B3722]MCX8607298.1 iron transporter [Gilliamella sp. B3771]MCX8610513.1 iron transporter [Gilliamella sp. B3891]MCX8612818.1 iron transporter [Gilliamella sp. B3773]MCX8614727.1 iron transporter [Gilliamella sp. B3770]
MKKLVLAAGISSILAFSSFANAEAPAPGEEKGFEEFPIGEEVTVGPLNVSAVYFQPVDMEPAGMGGLPASKSDMHLEADISANEDNVLGYGIGTFVPYLTVKYKIQKEGSDNVIEGNFMPMNASDGPHYGNNVKLDGAGKYKVTFIIESPEKQGYLLHVDKETGVEGRFWTTPYEVSWDFDFIPRAW